LSLPNWEAGEASRDSAYVLAGSCTRVHHRQGARMAGRANSPGRVPLDLWVRRGTRGGPRDSGRERNQAEARGRITGWTRCGGLADRRHRRLTTIRFERFIFQASASGGGIDCNGGCSNTWTIADTRAEKCVFQAPANSFVCEPLKDASGNPVMVVCKTTYACTGQAAQAGFTCGVQKYCVSASASNSCSKCIAVASQVTQPTYYCKNP
jgi:hypothetical protein